MKKIFQTILQFLQKLKKPTTWILFLISLGLSIHISQKFFQPNLSVVSTLTIIGQIFITFIAAGGIFSEKIQEKILNYMGYGNRTKKSNISYLFSTIFFVLVITIYLLLPQIAVLVNNFGALAHQNGNLSIAQDRYELAISLDENYSTAHYNLGLIYEDLFENDSAKKEYKMAIMGGLDSAFNNLARLYILEGNYSKATTLLRGGLEIVENHEDEYQMLKNLGWALLMQERISESISILQQSVNIFPEKGAAHCLLAQGYEQTNQTFLANSEWDLCLSLADIHNPDEDIWVGMAIERLNDQ